MLELANVNGTICPVEEARIPAEDRGFLFGDGVYEVIRTYRGRMWAADLHFERLERSLRELEIENYDLGQYRRWVVETWEASEIAEALIYFQVTRGSGPRSHVWTRDLRPTFFLTARPFPSRAAWTSEGVKVQTFPDWRWGRCDIKSINLLPNVLAKQQARKQGAYEALFVSERDEIREGASCAVFGVRQGVLVTPPLTHHVLPSITRKIVIEIAREFSIPSEEETTRIGDFARMDEAFLASTGDEVAGITHLDGKPLGNGKPGEITKKLQEEYQRRVTAK
jgi:D-alanine transaminase